MNVELLAPDSSRVSSFETGIIVQKGPWIGICLKLSMYDRSEKLMHWLSPLDRTLQAGLFSYAATIGKNSLMFQAQADPNFGASLPTRHPFHTLLNEVPKLSASEIGGVCPATKVVSVEFVPRGGTLELRAIYGDKNSDCIHFHEYTVISLFGYMDKMLEGAAALAGPVGGSA